MEDSTEAIFLFRPARFLGTPSIVAPSKTGKISVVLQFIIPNLHISDLECDKYKILLKKCDNDIWDSHLSTVKNKEGQLAILVTTALYIDAQNDDAGLHQAIENKSRIIIERFLGIVSYCAGAKLSAINIINTITEGPSFIATLNMTGRTQSPRIKFSITQKLIEDTIPSDEIFTALFWLRRGLAEADPIDTYNAFIVCLQILARIWWERKSPGIKIPSITSLFKEYITSELGADSTLVEKAWKKRNAIAAHGNKLNISAEDFVGLIELKFEAANWAYDGINKALGLDSEIGPKISQNFFVVDALMNID